MDIIEEALVRVVESMRTNLGDQLTIDDMARTAMLSKFHFSRVFQKVTGLSPGRFLSAVRLQEAKRLLLTTGLSVTEISHRVGYASVGTFSSRFRSSVGVSPTMFRQMGGFTEKLCPDQRTTDSGRCATVAGHIWEPKNERPGLIFAGLFRDRLPHGTPIRCTILQQPGRYLLEHVPPGEWYLLTHSVAADRNEILRPYDTEPGLFVGSTGPITIKPGHSVKLPDVQLRPARFLDPPVLLALVDLRTNALRERMG